MFSGNQDEFVSMAQAAKLLPGRPSIVSLWRWRARGIAGVKLKFVNINAKPYTTRRWLREFILKSSEWQQEARLDEARGVNAGCETDSFCDAIA